MGEKGRKGSSGNVPFEACDAWRKKKYENKKKEYVGRPIRGVRLRVEIKLKTRELNEY
jgi:hypothetical protein